MKAPVKQYLYVHPGCRSSGKTLSIIMQQKLRIAQLEAELAAVKRERDAAVRDIIANCAICKHHDHERIRCKLKITLTGEYADDCMKFEWRGVCPENTEVRE